MATTSTIIIKSLDNTDNTVFKVDTLSPCESVETLANYLQKQILGCGGSSVDMQINNAGGSQATGTVTVSGGAVGDTVVIAGTTLTAVDHRQTTNVTFLADSSGSLNSKFFTFQSQGGNHLYYMWFNINGAGVDPAPAGRTGIMVAGATNASAATLATAAVAAAVGTVNVAVTAGASGHIIITYTNPGVTTAPADGSAPTSFTFTNVITGSAITSAQYNIGYTDAATALNEAAAINANTTIDQYVMATTTVSAASLLGNAGNFGVLAGSTITNTGNTVVTGSIALSPGTSVTGFPPGTYSGSEHIADSTAAGAQTALTLARNSFNALPSTQNLSGQDLGTVGTLAAGVYTFSSSAQLTGNLTLNGSATDVFVFQIGSTLTTATGSAVSLTGGATPNNVYWIVGSSATIGTSTLMQGNILAVASITMNTSASLAGRALAGSGAVTLQGNAIIQPSLGGSSTVVNLTSNDYSLLSNLITLSATAGNTASGAFLTGGLYPTHNIMHLGN